jgi:uncharacterized membrane protein YkvA (DUF1232 family)
LASDKSGLSDEHQDRPEGLGPGYQEGRYCPLHRRPRPSGAMYVKAAAAAVAAYALSPIDLIPDFIPVLGYLDDVIILPIAIALVIRMIPEPLMAEFRTKAQRRAERPVSHVTAVMIIDLLDLETARAEALEAVCDLWDGLIDFGSGAVIEITDETGTVILTLPFVPATGAKKGTLH